MARLLASALALLFPTGAAAGVQVWPVASVTAQVGSGWRGTLELSGPTRGGYASGQVAVRVYALHPVARNLSAGGGYTHVAVYAETGSDFAEDQLFEQLSWDMGALGRAHLTSRTRFEQRFQPGGGEVAWRLREQVRLFLPAGAHGARVALYAEPFLNLNRTPRIRQTFDQLRMFAGLNLPVARSANLEFGYLGQLVHRPAGDAWVHALPVSLSVRL